MHSMLLSSRRCSPSCSNTIAPEKRPRVPTKPRPDPKAVTPQPPSLAVQAKIKRLHASQDHPGQKKTRLRSSTTHPGYVIVSSTALLAALMTFHADWEVGDIDPARIDVEILREIVAEGLPPCDEGSRGLEQWWKGMGDVVVDLSRSGELDFERSVRARWRGELAEGEETELGSLLLFEVEKYYATVEHWEEGRWRWYGS